MSENDENRTSRKRLLPSLLLAGAMAAPAVAAPIDLGDLIHQAGQVDQQTLVDAQANYSQTRTVTAPQWAEVTWGKVTWVREVYDDY